MAVSRDRFVVVVSNRGPYSYVEEAGDLRARPGAGGLASALAPALEDGRVAWIAAAVGAGDREASRRGVLPDHLSLLDIDESLYHRFYDDVANSTLWFLHHGLFDRARNPSFGAEWHRSWDAYRNVNEMFATAVDKAAPPGAVVLVQVFHLALVAGFLARSRPDLHLVHFSHTPFVTPSEIRVLPDAVAREMLRAMTAFRACGFHSERWERAFRSTSDTVVGEHPATFVSPLGPDVSQLRSMVASEACDGRGKELEEAVGERRLVVRVDRLDPAKNLLRGFEAFDELLAEEPRWRGEVVFAALANPSRQSAPEYTAYRADVESKVAAVNERWGTTDWTPILLHVGDDVSRSMAALQRFDVLLVNSVRDGLNLVAKEGALVNARDGVTVLSRESGAGAELSGGAIGVDPFNVLETRMAISRALQMSPRERAARAAAVRSASSIYDPGTWFQAQMAAAIGRPVATLHHAAATLAG
jgi:trehalose 6-phosphate synthase